MKEIKSIELSYGSGYFEHEQFEETLKINYNKISYKKIFATFLPQKYKRISWEVEFVFCHEVFDVINEISEDLKKQNDIRVCDGDILSICVFYKDGTREEKSFPYWGYPDLNKKYHELFTAIIPPELLFPEFLKEDKN